MICRYFYPINNYLIRFYISNNRNPNLEKQISDRHKTASQIINIYKLYNKNLNEVSRYLIVKALIPKISQNKNIQPKIQQVINECIKDLVKKSHTLNNNTFCKLMSVVKILHKIEFNLSNELKQKLFKDISDKFHQFTLKQLTFVLRPLKYLFPVNLFKDKWINFYNNIRFNQIKLNNQNFTELVFIYDAISFNYQQLLNQSTIDPHKKIIIQQFKSILLNKILQQLSLIHQHRNSIQQNILVLPFLLKAYARNIQMPTFYQQFTTQFQKIIATLKQQQLTIPIIIAIIEIIKLGSIPFNQTYSKIIYNGLLAYKSHSTIKNFQQQETKQQIGLEKNQTYQEGNQDQNNRQQNTIIQGLEPRKINIILNFFNHFKWWNPQLITVLENSFFQLVYTNKIEQVNIRIYCLERSKMGQILIKLINQSTSQDKNPKTLKIQTIRTQVILKQHLRFFNKLIDYLNQNYQIYKTQQILKIIDCAQLLTLASRKLKKKVRKLLEAKGIQDSKQGLQILQKLS